MSAVKKRFLKRIISVVSNCRLHVRHLSCPASFSKSLPSGNFYNRLPEYPAYAKANSGKFSKQLEAM
jgi:hypothetical protein